MTANPFAHLRVSMCAVFSAPALMIALAGCNSDTHESADARPPASMSVPAANTPNAAIAKATPPRPNAPVPPPPSDADMGMPVYPNASTYVDTLGNFSKFDKSAGVALLQTSDSVDSVIAFYKGKITQSNSRGQATPATPSEKKQNGKREVVLTGNDAEGNTQVVEAREDEGKTVIELMTMHTKGIPASIPGANKAGETSASTPPPASSAAASMPPASGKLP